MNETRQSLLLRAQTGEQDAWKELTDLYRPLFTGWLQRRGPDGPVPPADPRIGRGAESANRWRPQERVVMEISLWRGMAGDTM